MGEKMGMEFGPGTLFISKDGENWTPLCEVEKATLEMPTDPETEKHIESLRLASEETIEAELTPESEGILRQVAAEIARQILDTKRRIMLAILQLYSDKGIRRAVHLAMHASKARTRKKNTRRVALTVLEVAKHG